MNERNESNFCRRYIQTVYLSDNDQLVLIYRKVGDEQQKKREFEFWAMTIAT